MAPAVADLTTAFTLILIVVFVMLQLRFVITKNISMERETTKILNMKLSIFIAVLVFNGEWHKAVCGRDIEDTVDSFAEHTGIAKLESKCVIKVCVLTGWLALQQLAIFLCRNNEKELFCWGGLLGHIVGFGYIAFFSAVWELADERLHPEQATAQFVLALAVVVIYVVTLSLRKVRRSRFTCHFHELIEEQEHDSCALCLSFLLAVYLRYVIAGVTNSLHELDHEVGHESAIPYKNWLGIHSEVTFGKKAMSSSIKVLKHDHSLSEAHLLLFSGVGIFTITTIITNLSKNIISSAWITVHRVLNVLHIVGSMMIAWTVAYAMRWYQDRFFKQLSGTSAQYLVPPSSSVMANVLYAFASSLIGFAWIYLLTKMTAGCRCTWRWEAPRLFLEPVSEALGLLIGISWEKSFDRAIDEVTQELSFATHDWETKRMASIMQLLFVLLVVVTTTYTWRKVIIPEVLHLSFEEESEREMEEALKSFKPKSVHEDFEALAEQEMKKLDRYYKQAKENLEELQFYGDKEKAYATCLMHMRRIVRHVRHARDHDYKTYSPPFEKPINWKNIARQISGPAEPLLGQPTEPLGAGPTGPPAVAAEPSPSPLDELRTAALQSGSSNYLDSKA